MRSQYILEAAAVIHDIACPLCREKYGNADGKHQEAESEPLVRAFLQGRMPMRKSSIVSYIWSRIITARMPLTVSTIRS